MKRLGILGGTFDPPHIAHLVLAQSAHERFALGKVLFIPAAIQPHKQRPDVLPGETRLKLLHLALDSDKRFEVSDMELKRVGPSYSVDTLLQLKEQHPEIELYLIIGGDNIADIEHWREPRRIFEVATVVAARRPHAKAVGRYKDKITMFDMPQIEISSTLIREMVEQGRRIKYLVPEGVEAYISEHGLYK